MHANHIKLHHMQQIIEQQRVVDKYRSMANGKRELIPLELDLFKKDPVINQHIMQVIDTDIFWYKKTFRGILMELWKIRNGKMITQTSEEHSEKETINICDESHAMFDDPRLYKGDTAQQDCDNTRSVSVSSEVQKNWPRKCFQINKNKSVESAMMCWENLEDCEKKLRLKRRLVETKKQMMTRKSKPTKWMTKNISTVQYIWGTDRNSSSKNISWEQMTTD